MVHLDILSLDSYSLTRVDESWSRITAEFERYAEVMPERYMERKELSFHNHIKLLGYLLVNSQSIDGDVVEIGVWKGKSLAFMGSLVSSETRIIGIDPLALKGQESEALYFQEKIFPAGILVKGYSQSSISKVLDHSRKFKLLHIDGGHKTEDVWCDFLMYERFIVPDGYLIFDDYGDHLYSPEVRLAVDRMHELNLFVGYEVIGQILPYENSFVLRKKQAKE